MNDVQPKRSVRASTAEVRAALERPDFYPHHPKRVKVRETHISWVFLAGDRAYKLKKPLVLPFLDYRTAQRRRAAARDEVRLNQCLAGDLYLGVRTVVPSAEGFALGDEDDPRALEHLVEMRRYDERQTLAAKLALGELKRAEVVSLARTLAHFHAHAREVDAPDRATQAIGRRIRQNFQELLSLVELGTVTARLLALERFADAFMVANAQMLAGRAREGFVREGHGDLRAEHVLLDGSVRVVDCIEFSSALRELDVADDLAFLVMDLTVRGGERFARMLVSAYRQAGGDPGEDQLVAFYASHRALVRAKVALLRAQQADRASATQTDEKAAAQRLLSAAERFAWRARLPLVIVICGFPASGKSSLAKAIGAASGIRHLNSDLVRKRLAGISATDRAPAETYSAAWNRRTYAELGRRTALEVKARAGALVDATFRHRSDREAFVEAFGHAAPLLFVECVAPAAELARRASCRESRLRSISDATRQVVIAERAAWQPLDEVPAYAHLPLRSDRPYQEQIADLSSALDRRLGYLH